MRTESYRNGKRHGKWTTYYDGGEQLKLEITLVDGKIHGERIEYFLNGKERNRTQFKEGKFDGPSVSYDESGRKKAEVNFSDGKLDGEARYWDTEGRERVRIYKDGELVQQDASDK